nr:DUF58 domain-containing protein [Schlegelella koreensis]
MPSVTAASAWLGAAALVAAIADVIVSRRAWRAAPLHWTRALPAAFAVGVRRPLGGQLANPGTRNWRVALFDGVDPSIDVDGLPFAGNVAPASSVEIGYHVRPRRRGPVDFDAATLRVRSRLGAFELVVRIGERETRHVYPNFAAVARYAWLAGDHRLAEIGIKSVAQRGAGTDFKQLSDYRAGDAIRDIDWKATLRQGRPIVREYQDERDQSVVFLLDCGRRMRADDGLAARHGSHFDAALDALMLLAYVALRDGDEVGALTFGTAPERSRRFAPRKGVNSLNALIGALYDIEPEATHSDYVAAATALLRWRSKRSLVVVLTNFRDEDASELGPALALLRTRHLVLLASLRERALRDLAEQPLVTHRHAIEAAGAHLFAQARDDAFARLAARDALLLDVEPQQLAPELVNRYRAVKRAGLL